MKKSELKKKLYAIFERELGPLFFSKSSLPESQEVSIDPEWIEHVIEIIIDDIFHHNYTMVIKDR